MQETILFQEAREPREGAFTFLMPAGWHIEGGIVRVNPMMRGGFTQSIEAKLDMAVMSDPQGTVMIHFLPSLYFCDLRMNPMIGGMFPPGSNYNGMTVMPAMPAAEFLWQVLFRQAHPQAGDARFHGAQPFPQLAQQKAQASMATGLMCQCDAAAVEYEYAEQDRRYLERAFCYIKSYGPMMAGMWVNEDTHLLRAPMEQFNTWLPVLEKIRDSMKISGQWAGSESRNAQAMGNMALDAQHQQQQRDQKLLDTQRSLNQMDQEIQQHRMMTSAEIQNDQYLTLMGQEEYHNPHSGDFERVEEQGKYRWVTPEGKDYFTDDPDYNPNFDPNATRTDYERSHRRPRFPGQ
ncbi:MAG: hypothetical protein RDV48_27850 [Candidatus Eremiobacteraeota bacterium]|nr:hypothetical protein [Candidatus Eremiobacteraeota bacterium]